MNDLPMNNIKPKERSERVRTYNKHNIPILTKL